MITDKKNTRRQWFQRTARWGLFATLAAGAGSLLRRNSESKEAPCVDPKGHLGCRSCSQLNGCGLPRALSVKRHNVAEASCFGQNDKEQL